MKMKLVTLALLGSLTVSGSVFAACDKPVDPEIPSGDSASGADMLKAKKDVETFISMSEEYLKCGLSLVEQDRVSSNMEKVAERFNVQLRAYKAKS